MWLFFYKYLFSICDVLGMVLGVWDIFMSKIGKGVYFWGICILVGISSNKFVNWLLCWKVIDFKEERKI